MKIYIKYLFLILTFGSSFMSFSMEEGKKRTREEKGKEVETVVERQKKRPKLEQIPVKQEIGEEEEKLSPEDKSLMQEIVDLFSKHEEIPEAEIQAKISEIEQLPIEVLTLILTETVKSYLRDWINAVDVEDIVMDSSNMQSERFIFNTFINYLGSVSTKFRDILYDNIFKSQIKRYNQELIKEKFKFYIQEFKGLSQGELNHHLTEILQDISQGINFEDIPLALSSPEVQAMVKDLVKAYALILSGAEPNLRFFKGLSIGFMPRFINNFTPLMSATIHNALGLVKLLISKGADINAKDSLGASALWYASYKNYKKIIEFLVKSRANVNVQDNIMYYRKAMNYHKTPLIFAINNNDIETTKLLLLNRANPNIADYGNSTPLIYAIISYPMAEEKNLQLVKLLLQHGADPNQNNVLAKTIWKLMPIPGSMELTLEQQSNIKKIINLLLKYGANPNTIDDVILNSPLSLAIMSNDIELVKLLLQYGANPNKQDSILERDRPVIIPDKGPTPLIRAVQENNPNMAQLLLEFEADPFIVDSTGRHAMDYVLASNNPNIKAAFLKIRPMPPLVD